MAALQTFFGGLTGLTILAFLASLGGAIFIGTRKKRNAEGRMAKKFGEIPKDETTPSPRTLPVVSDDPDLAERASVAQYIAKLMLADEWTEIAQQVSHWENQLAATPSGARYHDIAADVALSGLQSLIDEAPRQSLADLREAEIELGHFIDTYQRATDSHILALLAARAHLAIGDACRADQWPEALKRQAWRHMARHYVDAGEILRNYDPLAHMSPLLAEARYLQALGSPAGSHRLPKLFENWIDLDPANPAIYDKHAEHLADPDVVSDEAILTEADRALDRTEETLGFGGYALFFQPLLKLRDGARHLLDADLFASAMLDLASMEASQAEVNQAANALAVEVRADPNQNLALSDTLYLMIQSHMEVIYPRLWTLPQDDVQALVKEAAEVIPMTHSDLANLEGETRLSEAA